MKLYSISENDNRGKLHHLKKICTTVPFFHNETNLNSSTLH